MLNLEFDREHIWHPYTSMNLPLPVQPVISAHGVRLTLEDGTTLIDGMSSWWSVIHGYNHPVLNAAAKQQIDIMAHVMFGGLTHRPAIELAELLIEITPTALQKIFFSDSGSVAVEVAIKMALQYWLNLGNIDKKRLLTIKCGYHGDTFATMAISDTGMHHIFQGNLMDNFYAESPKCKFNEECTPGDLQDITSLLESHHQTIAAIILEPIVQATGGMNFYSPAYLEQVKQLSLKYDVLLICDEIATGFGRTGKLFACEHASIEPDIMCIGKALTGGYMSLAATLCTEKVSNGISKNNGTFMHGPTFMANPLACATAFASIKLLLDSPWQLRVANIEQQLQEGLGQCCNIDSVVDVRVLGAIGVVEMEQNVDMAATQQYFVEKGVWIRPFGKLIYIMPPYIISVKDLQQLIEVIIEFTKAPAFS